MAASQPQICSARTCNNEIGDSDQAYHFPSGSRGIAWQELLLGEVFRKTGSLTVCSSHFSERQFVRGKNGQLCLARNALPDRNILSGGSVCRFCMETSKVNMYPLFGHHPDVPSLEDIERTVNIRIRPQDGLPQQACATCMSKVRYIKRIQDQFQESDRKLRAHLNVPKCEDDDDEPAMEEEYLLEQQPQSMLLTADQLTIVEGAQEEIETSETNRSREPSPIALQPVKIEESTTTTECMMLFSGDIQESTATETDINSVEYDMTELCTDGDVGGGAADSDETANAGNDSDDQQAEQKNGNTYKPFRYSKRARRERVEY